MARIVVDPVTRIEGHLRIEAQVEGGMIADAWSSGTMFRGIELILRGRDPREAWIWAQRICGVCTMVHALASVNAVEDALGIEIPDNARLVRNIIAATQTIQDHVVHFYHLHALDWVDILSALKADPAKTAQLAQSISDWPVSSEKYFKGVQDRVSALVASKQLSLFGAGYWGHPAYRLPPEANLMAVAHYLGSVAIPEGIHPDSRGSRRQESSLADVPRRRHGHCHGSERAGRDNQPGTNGFSGAGCQVGDRICESGVHSRCSGRGRFLPRVVQTRRRRWELHVLWRLSARVHQGSCGLLSSQGDHPGPRPFEGSPSRSRKCHGICGPFLVRIFGWRPGCKASV